MSSLNTLNKRLNYYGGKKQQDRMKNDKVRSLKKAILYSYQGQTIVLKNNKKFKCLINPDKNKPAYDNKIISIPYKDINLDSFPIQKTSQGIEDIEICTGDTFLWEETNTHWLIYLQDIEETAYFRAEIRRCDQSVNINNIPYWVYIRGPTETAIEWTQKAKIEWNTLNYSLVMYITMDKNTKQYFKRFKTVKIYDPKEQKNKTWQIVGVDPYYGDNILQVFLDEYYENSIADLILEKKQQLQDEEPLNRDFPYIDGPVQVTQYSKAYYQIKNITGGHWYLKWHELEQDLNSQKEIIPLNISIGDLGIFTLIYRVNGIDDITLDVNIVPL